MLLLRCIIDVQICAYEHGFIYCVMMMYGCGYVGAWLHGNMIHMSKIAWNIIKIILSICMHLKVKIHLKSNKNMYAYKHNRYMGKMIWENDIQGYMIPRA